MPVVMSVLRRPGSWSLQPGRAQRGDVLGGGPPELRLGRGGGPVRRAFGRPGQERPTGDHGQQRKRAAPRSEASDRWSRKAPATTCAISQAWAINRSAVSAADGDGQHEEAAGGARVAQQPGVEGTARAVPGFDWTGGAPWSPAPLRPPCPPL